jgi:hypothetical protein
MIAKKNLDITSLTPNNRDLDSRALKFHDLLVSQGLSCLLISSFGKNKSNKEVSNPNPSKKIKYENRVGMFWRIVRKAWYKFRDSHNFLTKLLSPIIFIGYVIGITYINFYRVGLIRSKVLIVHESIFTFTALTSKLIFGVKIIVDVHDDYQALTIPFRNHYFYRFFKEPFDEFLRRILYKNAHVCITVSDSLAGELSSRYSRNFEVVLNTNNFFSQNKLLYPKELTTDSIDFLNIENITGLFIGNFKNSLDLSFLDPVVWHEFNNKIKFVFYGNGYEKIASKFKQCDYVSFNNAVDLCNDSFDFNNFDFGFMPLNNKDISVKFALPNGLFTLIDARLPILFPNLTEMVSLNNLLNYGLLSDFSDPSDIMCNISKIVKWDYKDNFRFDLYYEEYNQDFANDRFAEIIQKLIYN